MNALKIAIASTAAWATTLCLAAPTSQCTSLGTVPVAEQGFLSQGFATTPCFEFSTVATSIAVTVNGVASAHFAGDEIGSIEVLSGTSSLTLLDSNGLQLQPYQITGIEQIFQAPSGETVSVDTGHAWAFGLTAGTYDLVLRMDGDDLLTPYTLGVSAVPEPGSAALWLAGLMSGAAVMRRRRRAQW